MQGNDLFATLEKKGSFSSSRSAESALITLERCQKLDLLIHLISNLRQTLVICGPNGIGKTTLLEQLKLKKNQDWPIHSILATANLSFESIENQLFQFLKLQYPTHKYQTLSSILSEQDKQNQKIVVIIDNAGLLVPGLIQTLIQYAVSTLCLRIVFSLTHDEIQLKNSTDRAIEDCHFIEIPSLTEKQCGVFLKNLSAQSGTKFPLSVCNDRLVENVYRETHGVPGKIVSKIPKLSENRVLNDYKWVSIGFIIIIAALGISFLIAREPEVKSEVADIKSPPLFKEVEEFQHSYTQTTPERKRSIYKESITQAIEKNKTDTAKISFDTKSEIPKNLLVEDFKKLNQGKDILVQHKKKVTDVFKGASQEIKKLGKNSTLTDDKLPAPVDIKKQNAPFLDETKVTKNLKDSLVKQGIKKSEAIQSLGSGKESIEKLVKNKSANVGTGIIPDRKVEKPFIVRNVAKTDKVNRQKTQSRNNVVAENDNGRWVMEQPEKYYTLQLMVLSKRQSVMEFLKKNQGLIENLKFFKKNSTGSNKYVLIYGAFKNIAAANKKKNLLPVEYRKAWVRKFGTLQKEINNN